MEVLKELFTSKKFIALLLGLAVEIIRAATGWDIDPKIVAGLVATYMASQGAADIGKSAALVKAYAEKVLGDGFKQPSQDS